MVGDRGEVMISYMNDDNTIVTAWVELIEINGFVKFKTNPCPLGIILILFTRIVPDPIESNPGICMGFCKSILLLRMQKFLLPYLNQIQESCRGDHYHHKIP